MNLDRSLQVSAHGNREILMRRVFDAPREAVFDAYTKPEFVKRWMLGPPGWSMPVCEIDLRVGGAFRCEWRGSGGDAMGMRGVYHEVVRAGRLVHTELFDEDWTGGETVVTTLFDERDNQTLLTCNILYASTEARDAVLKSPMEEGVAASYDRLQDLLPHPKTDSRAP